MREKRAFLLLPVLCLFLANCNQLPSDLSKPLELLLESNDSPTEYSYIHAVTRENLEAIKESVEHDVDLNQEYGLRPLQYAMQNSNDRIIEYYLEQGVELNYLDRFGQTPLMYGCGAGASTSFPMGLSVEQVEMLIEHGADVNMRATNGKTALDYALIEGKLRVILLLLDKSAQVDAKTWNYYLKNRSKLDDPIYGDSNLQYKIRHELLSRYLEADPAAESGYCKALEAAIIGDSKTLMVSEILEEEKRETVLHAAAFCNTESLARLITPEEESDYREESGNKYTPLSIAAFYGNLENVKYLWGGASDEEDKYGINEKYRAFGMANAGGNIETTQFFLDQGLDIQRSNSDGSARYGQVEMLEFLFDHGRIVKADTLFYGAQRAGDYGHYEVYPILLENGLDPNSIFNDDRQSLLSNACWADSEEAVKALVEYGAEINYRVLMNAVKYSSPEIMEYLLENGGDPDLTNSGETPLVPAVMQGELAKVKLLVEHGADIELYNEDFHYSVLIRAARESNHILEYLLDQGALIDYMGDGTALMNAISVGHVENVKLLIERGADPTLKNREGETALSIAQAGKNEEIIAMVEDYLEQWKA